MNYEKESLEQIIHDLYRKRDYDEDFRRVSELCENLSKLRKEEEEMAKELLALIKYIEVKYCENEQQTIEPNKQLTVYELGLSAHATHRLIVANIHTVNDILNFGSHNLITLRQVGEVTANEIRRKMAEIGYEHF